MLYFGQKYEVAVQTFFRERVRRSTTKSGHDSHIIDAELSLSLEKIQDFHPS